MPHDLTGVIDVIAPPPRVVAVDVYSSNLAGPVGPQGIQGIQGIQGEQGIQGPPASTVQAYTFANQTSVPPQSGSVRFNNSDQASATALFLHYVNDDGIDIKTYLLQRLKPGDTLFMQDRDDSTRWMLYLCTAVADSGSYATISVTWEAGGTALAGQQKIIIMRES